MSGPSNENKSIAKAAAAVFGGAPAVHRYWDDDRKSSIAVLSSEDRPQPGVTSYATVGLSDHALVRAGREFPTRVEFVGACASRYEEFANCLATAAACVSNSGWFVAPGIIFPDVFHMYRTTGEMRHAMFVPPFLWGDEPKTMVLESKTVAWLLMIPISEPEMRLAEASGSSSLEDLFVERQIDVFDLDRASVV